MREIQLSAHIRLIFLVSGSCKVDDWKINSSTWKSGNLILLSRLASPFWQRLALQNICQEFWNTLYNLCLNEWLNRRNPLFQSGDLVAWKPHRMSCKFRIFLPRSRQLFERLCRCAMLFHLQRRFENARRRVMLLKMIRATRLVVDPGCPVKDLVIQRLRE